MNGTSETPLEQAYRRGEGLGGLDAAGVKELVETSRKNETLNLTIGRATNEQLERTTAVSWKSEGPNEGPIFLEQNGDGSGWGTLVPFRKGDDAEWFVWEAAEALANELGVPVRSV